jgi:small-conductance mechanosensitive channel
MKAIALHYALQGAGGAFALPGSFGSEGRIEAKSLFELFSTEARFVLDWPLFMIGNMPVTLLFVVKCVLFLVALSLLTRVSRYVLGSKILAHTKMERGVQYALLRAFGYVVFLLGLIVGLDTTGLNLRSLLVVGGALGLGVGLGLQNIVANFVAGLVILWEGPVKVGDLIEVGDTQGEVIRIGARGTWVRTFDNHVIIVPNSEFINQRVSNWTANDRIVRLSIPVGVSYNSNLDQVRDVLIDIARSHPDVLVSPAPAAMVTGLGDNAVNVVLRVSTSLMTERTPTIKSDLFYEIFRVFREKKIEMPNPQRDLHVRSVDVPFVVATQASRGAAG